ncbi:glycosyltransferase [Flexithrix dorotheae]|uniref:glycosyltransferase n=1 Tax=Flexithrix dorotheae TaxID=70993 RepID=UPI000378E3D2|nr:glycosyltransferase [Flexithrix dorotheae]
MTNKIPTLYLSYDGMTDPLGQSQVLPYLTGLSKNGYEITLISFEKEENEGRIEHIKTITLKSGIKWIPLTYTKQPPVLSTLFDIWQIKQKVKKLHQKNRFKIVHCRSYITALIGLWLKRTYGIKFIFDMRGFFPDERVDGGIWNLDNPVFKRIYNYFKKKEIEYFSEADHSISLTHSGEKIIHSWKEVNSQPIPIKVIPCCVDTNHFRNENICIGKRKKLQETLQIADNSFVMSYLGSIGTWYMLPEMMAFFKRLLLKKKDAIFLFITAESPEKIHAEALKNDIPIENIKIKKADREEVPLLLSFSSLSIFFIKPVFSKKASSPTKQGEIMNMGIPLICNSGVGDTDYVVEKYKSGYLVNEFSDNCYDQAIDNLDQILNLDKKRIIDGAEEFYSLSKGVENYSQVYREVLL